MISENAKKSRMVFLFIYLIFAVLLVYLFMFNTGLEITENVDVNANLKQVFLENTTNREINNISIFYKENEQIENAEFLEKIDTLKPGEKKLVEFEGIDSNQIVLIVKSPFHLTFEKMVLVNPTSTKKDVSVSLDIPSNVLFGKNFEFHVETCNDSTEQQQIKIEEIHENRFFSEPSRTNIVTINSEECKITDYSLLPIMQGETTIYFKVNISNSIKELEQTVVVE